MNPESVAFVKGKTIAEVWEASILEVWKNGIPIKTEYDVEDEPFSKDLTMVMLVEEPLAEPRIHLAVPCDITDLEIYRLEVEEGIHDHWIKPEEGKWTYTYYKRLFDYQVVDDLSNSNIKSPFASVNQIKYIIKKLSEAPHSRRAQAITWMPTADPQTDDPPCLQRIWCRILEDPEYELRLNMNTNWRSRDAYKAAFMNMYAFTDLQRIIAERISEKIGKEVKVGKYIDVSDSYHIYGKYFNEFQNKFLKMVETRPFEKRVWRSDDKYVKKCIEEAHAKLADERAHGK